MTIYTIGHSTRTLEAFVALLQTYDVEQLADIRSVPRSRRHPHFSLEALSVSLASVGIVYRRGLSRATALSGTVVTLTSGVTVWLL